MPIFILSTFRAFNYYSNNGVNELFLSSYSWDDGKYLAEKLFWKLRNRDFVPISWNFLKEKINLAKTLKWTHLENHWYLSKKWAHLIKNLLLIRTFIHEYCEVFNMTWHFYVIVFIVLGIFSERLTNTSCQDFSLWFLAFL